MENSKEGESFGESYCKKLLPELHASHYFLVFIQIGIKTFWQEMQCFVTRKAFLIKLISLNT